MVNNKRHKVNDLYLVPHALYLAYSCLVSDEGESTAAVPR